MIVIILVMLVVLFIIGRWVYRNFHAIHTARLQRRTQRWELQQKKDLHQMQLRSLSGQENRANDTLGLDYIRVLISSKEMTKEQVSQKLDLAKQLLQIEVMKMQLLSDTEREAEAKRMLSDINNSISNIQNDIGVQGKF